MKQNYTPGSMSFSDGFNGPRGNVGFTMVYDEEKAKKIINKLLSEKRNIDFAKVGLDGDWDCNSDTLYSENEFNETYFHDNSIWATPIMIVNFFDSPSECYEVWSKSV